MKKRQTKKIKKIHFFLLLLILCIVGDIGLIALHHSTSTNTQQYAAEISAQPVGPSGNWSIVYDDEFNDTPGMSGPTNGLASSKWNSGWYSGPSNPGVGTQTVTTPVIQSLESEYHGPSSIIFPGDDALHIRLQKGIDNGGSYAGKNIESGLINTAGLLAFNPANVPVSTSSPDLRPYTINGPSVLEIRAQVPGPNADASAYWPAIWLTNAGNYGGINPSGTAWPGGQKYSEEIDLTEFYAYGSLGSQGRFNLHAASEYGGMSSVPSSMQNTDLSTAYHTYTYLFTSTSIQLWVDGIFVTGITPTAAQIAAQWQYPQYLLIAFQAVNGAIYPTANTGQPSDMMIDYVRAWQLKNLVANPGCEADTSGWMGYQATLSATTTIAHSGTASCTVALTSGTYYALDDNPNTVINPKQGDVYNATAWVRTDTAIGKPAYLAIRMSGGANPTKTLYDPTGVLLNTSWQQLANTVTVDYADRTSLEVYLVQENATAGDAFQADDISLQLNSFSSTPSPTSAPTPLPTATPTNTPTPLPTSTPTPTPTPVNLIQNNSFETTGTNWLNPWQLQVRSGAAAAINQDSNIKIDKNYAAKITITKSNPTDWYLQLLQGNIPLNGSHVYTISFYAKASKSLPMRIGLQQNAAPYSQYVSQSFNLTSSWNQYTLTFTQPLTEAALFSFNFANTIGSIWLDKVILQ